MRWLPLACLTLTSALAGAGTETTNVFQNAQIQKGDRLIASAQKDIDAGNYKDAFTKLRSGVHFAPDNLDGRLLLSEYYIYIPSLKNLPHAEEILADGLPYAHNDIDYVKRYIQIVLRQQKDEQLAQFTREWLARPDNTPEFQQLLAISLSTALLYRGHLTQAQAVAEQYHLADSLEGLLLIAKIAQNRDDYAAAIALLEDGLKAGLDPEPLYAALSECHREQDNHEKALEYAKLQIAAAPDSSGPHIDMLYALDALDRQDEASELADKILQDFTAEHDLLKLANYATDEGKPDLCQRIVEKSRKQKYNPAPFELLLIESHINAKDYAQALQLGEALDKANPDWLKNIRHIFNALQLTANTGAGNDEAAEKHLAAFLKERSVRSESALAIARSLQELERPDLAQRVLLSTHERTPDNEAVLAKLIQVEIELGQTKELPTQVDQLLTLRNPPLETLTKIYAALEAQDGPEAQATRQTLKARIDSIKGQ